MSVSVVPSSAVALIERTLLAQLNSASAPPSDSGAQTNPAGTQLTLDLVSLLKELSSGSIANSKKALAQVQQDLQSQADIPSSNSPLDSLDKLDHLLTQVSRSLSSTTDTSTALHDLVSYLTQVGEGSGSVVNTSA